MVEFNQTRANDANYLQGFGGDTSNAIIACARQGAPCAYLTRIGDDAFGHKLLGLWQAESVGTQGVRPMPLRTPQSISSPTVKVVMRFHICAAARQPAA